MVDTESFRVAVLVEGPSDVAAVEAVAAARGRTLAAEGIRLVSMGGATNVGRYVDLLGPSGRGLRLVGLCDEGERHFYARALEPVGGGFFVCSVDLEDELIRALGVSRVIELVQAEGELRALRTFQRQPAQLGRPESHQLRRFLGTQKGRKIRYGRVLAEALDPDHLPIPLDGLLATV